jgi:peptidoglycan/LPS O-acetylase OafA/YrhL
VIPLGLIGLYRKPRAFLSLFAAVLVIAIVASVIKLPLHLPHALGDPATAIRLTGMFFSGSAFYVFRKYVPYRTDLAALAIVLLCAFMFSHRMAEIAVALFGGYLLFWFAFLPNTSALNRINNSVDLSYGTYLYAWPIQKLLIRFMHDPSPWFVILATAIGAGILAYISWMTVEKPSLSVSMKRQTRAVAQT